MNKLFSLFALTVLIPSFLFVWSEGGIKSGSIEQSTTDAMVQPGDLIGTMVVSTGAENAVPLWEFCSPPQHTANSTISECRVPAIPRLAIGHIVMPGDDALARLDWSEINWQLTIDGLPVDLKRFGSYDFVLPARSHDPSPVREVFVEFTAWDIVLTDLEPGQHTLSFMAESKMGNHLWLVNLEIEPVDGTQSSWRPFPLPSYVESLK
ncbi:MAG: hypothetical protein M3Y68_00685 [Chloroflexota bacterium]|nr:hypothetical protein [Chloroflexota bacterium]